MFHEADSDQFKSSTQILNDQNVQDYLRQTYSKNDMAQILLGMFTDQTQDMIEETLARAHDNHLSLESS